MSIIIFPSKLAGSSDEMSTFFFFLFVIIVKMPYASRKFAIARPMNDTGPP